MHTEEQLDNQDLGLQTKDPYWGVLGTGERETDYQFAAGVLELPKPRNTFWMNQNEYHQPEVSKVSCTVHGSLGALSDLTGYRFTLEQRKEMWAEALKRGAKEGWGWYTARAVDLVREFGKKYIGDDFLSFRVNFKTEDLYDSLDAGYTIVCSFRGNKAYNEDRADGILNGLEFGASSYGHCVRMVPTVEKDEFEIVVDNYINSRPTSNRYKVSRANLKKLVANGVFVENGYVFVYRRDFEKMEQEVVVPVWAVSSIEKAKKLGLEDWSNPDEVVGNAIAEAVFFKLGGLTQQLGDLTKARQVVALDRLGVLDKLIEAKGL